MQCTLICTALKKRIQSTFKKQILHKSTFLPFSEERKVTLTLRSANVFIKTLFKILSCDQAILHVSGLTVVEALGLMKAYYLGAY